MLAEENNKLGECSEIKIFACHEDVTGTDEDTSSLQYLDSDTDRGSGRDPAGAENFFLVGRRNAFCEGLTVCHIRYSGEQPSICSIPRLYIYA